MSEPEETIGALFAGIWNDLPPGEAEKPHRCPTCGGWRGPGGRPLPLGFRVAIRFSETFPLFKEWPTGVLRNVTEIHLGYKTIMPAPRIAFESDVHATGVTYALSEIAEFEAAGETEIGPEFYERADK